MRLHMISNDQPAAKHSHTAMLSKSESKVEAAVDHPGSSGQSFGW